MKKYLAVIVLFLLMSVSCDSGNGPVTPEPPSREWLMKQVEIFLVEWGYPTPIHPGTDMSPDGTRLYLAYTLTDWGKFDACTKYDRLLYAMSTEKIVKEVVYRFETPRHLHWDVPNYWEPESIPCP